MFFYFFTFFFNKKYENDHIFIGSFRNQVNFDLVTIRELFEQPKFDYTLNLNHVLSLYLM